MVIFAFPQADFHRIAALAGQRTKQQFAVADLAGFSAVLFDDDVEPVGLAQATLEIDDVAHLLDELGGLPGGNAGTAQGAVEAAAHRCAYPQRGGIYPDRYALQAKAAVAAAADFHPKIERGPQGQAFERARHRFGFAPAQHQFGPGAAAGV